MATDPGADTRYLLPSEESERIFHDHIVPLLLTGATPSPEPTVVVLTAQPGAGKTTMASQLAARFQGAGNAVRVDVDLFKPFHPRYTRLMKEVGAMAGDLVHADARRWFERSLDHLSEHRLNVIAEHGLRNHEVTGQLLTRFATAGYRVEAALLGTPAAESKLGILERYQLAYEKTGVGRMVEQDLHDARYEHLLQAADWLDNDPRVATVTVYRPGEPEPLHRNQRTMDGTWEQPISTREAIQTERNEPWDTNRSRRFLVRHHSLANRLAPEWQQRLASAQADAEHRLHPDTPRGPTRDGTAITYGRYQLVSIAHLDTVRTIAYDWPRVVVGVLDLQARSDPPADMPDHLRGFYQTGEANMAPARNPMSIDERLELWQAALDTAGLSDRVSVEAMPPPELDPNRFNQRYPAADYDLVFPAAGGVELPHQQRAEILGRPVHTVEPPLEYHTSDIRQSYREGTDLWRRGLATGTLDAFIAAGGPERLLTIQGKSSPVDENLAAARADLDTANAALDRNTSSHQHGAEPSPPAERPGPDVGP